MIRTLFIIAGAALVLCIVTAGGAIAIGHEAGAKLDPAIDAVRAQAEVLAAWQANPPVWP